MARTKGMQRPVDPPSNVPETEPIRIEAAQPVRPEAALYRSTSHVSGPDAFDPHPAPLAASRTGKYSYREAGDEVYDRLSPRRKAVIVAVMSFCAFLSPVSSTTVLAATPEVAGEYGTTGSIINLSNAGYMVFMGISPIVWGPISQVFGRWPVSANLYRRSLGSFCQSREHRLIPLTFETTLCGHAY